MSSEIKQLVISNNEDAWNVMRQVLAGDILKESFELVFDDWPKIHMKIDGEDWKQTIPTRFLPSIIEMQKELHRTYAAIHYGEANARRLTDQEREMLEIVLHVDEGSSEIWAPIERLFNKMAEGAMSKMEARHFVILLLGVGVLYAGNVSWKDWLENKAKEMDSQAQITMNGQTMHAQEIMSEQETQRLEIFNQATKESQFLKDAAKSMQEIRNDQLRAMKPQDKLTIEGVEVSGSVASELTHKPRGESVERRIDGSFRIELLDTTQKKGFRIKVKRDSDGLEFQASVGDLEEAQLEALKAATWSKRSIGLEINAKELRGSITAASVVAVAVN